MLAGQPATIRSDIYALGVMLYQLATGALNRPLTSDWSEDISDPLLREDIHNCVAGDPTKRFAGGAQLSAHLRGLSQRRAEKEAAERLRARSARRKKQVRLVSGAAAAVAIIAIFVTFAFVREHKLKLKIAEEGHRAEKALDDLRRQAPALRQLAEGERGFQRFDSALEKLEAALVLDPAHLPSYWHRAWIFVGTERLVDAAAAIRVAQEKDPAHGELAAILPTIEKLATLTPDAPWPAESAKQLRNYLATVGASGEMVALSARLMMSANDNAKLVRQRLDQWIGTKKGKTRVNPSGLVEIDLSRIPIDTLEPLRGMPFDSIAFTETSVSSLEPLRGMRLVMLKAYLSKISDLSPLRSMPLQSINISHTQVTDLSPLRGAPLERIDMEGLDHADFSPLRGAPIKWIRASSSLLGVEFLADAPLEELVANQGRVADLSPLRGKPLKVLTLGQNKIADLSPLRGSVIEDLSVEKNPIKDFTPLLTCTRLEKLRVSKLGKLLEPLRAHPSLKFIAYDDEPYRPVAEFWTEYDAQQGAGKK
jgi:tetratricopeptide (TPR) repeat protein